MNVFPMRAIYLISTLTLFLFSSCYSFKTTSISPEVQTFYVLPFDNKALNATPTIAQNFSERLQNKIRSESRLAFTEVDPHVSFSGAVTRFQVSSIAPEEDGTSALNRLEITVNVAFENTVDEKKSYKRDFSFFDDYPKDTNLLNVQDELIDNIFSQIVEDIFNASFNNW